MNIKKLLPSIILYVAFVLLHESLAENIFQLGASWTFSQLLPYLLQFIAAVLFGIQLIQVLPLRNGILNKVILVLSIFALSGIAFAVHPIYEGDFSNTYDEITMTSNKEMIDAGLTMIALPGCPYCKARIGLLNQLKSRNENLSISVVMASSDPSTIEFYEETLTEGISLRTTENPLFFGELALGSFPCFIYKDKKQTLYRWNQKGFGTSALDWIEEGK